MVIFSITQLMIRVTLFTHFQ